MPELAEVEFYRKQWDPGLGQIIRSVEGHPRTRVMRGVNILQLKQSLTGSQLVLSEARGKQMVFRFANQSWLGLHLGMTGRLQAAPTDFRPGNHDHLVLHQAAQSLVFSDPRQFGRILFHAGTDAPVWWSELAPGILSQEFTPERVRAFLQRHARLTVKAALLLQEGFPGIGNWMADEILWRARLNPRRLCGQLPPASMRKLWQLTRFVAQRALATIGQDFRDPPRGWLFNERWDDRGRCPKHRVSLARETVGGRTTAWCRQCQRPSPS